MSRAFVKEDIDVPERSGARRSAGGLPAGAVNYITAAGAEVLMQRLDEKKQSGADREEVQRLEEVLRTAVAVPLPSRSDAAVFGSTVTLVSDLGMTRKYRIVGVDEVELAAENVSWVSPLGKTLLGTTPQQKLKLPPDDSTVWQVQTIA